MVTLISYLPSYLLLLCPLCCIHTYQIINCCIGPNERIRLKLLQLCASPVYWRKCYMSVANPFFLVFIITYTSQAVVMNSVVHQDSTRAVLSNIKVARRMDGAISLLDILQHHISAYGQCIYNQLIKYVALEFKYRRVLTGGRGNGKGTWEGTWSEGDVRTKAYIERRYEQIAHFVIVYSVDGIGQ